MALKRFKPLGGKLVDRTIKETERESVLKEAVGLPSVTVSRDIAVILEMFATGVLSPLEGFIGHEDYTSVLDEKRLADGTPWALPYKFVPDDEVAQGIDEGGQLALLDSSGKPVAVLSIDEKYNIDKEVEAEKVFGTSSREHPGVDRLFKTGGNISLSGPIDLIHRPSWGPFEKYRLEPKDTARVFYEERNWKTIVGFQTANPVHRGHEYIQKCALELLDGLFIHPIIETTRKEYFRNEFRIKSYEVALENYYPMERVVLAPLRVIMNYAGPREALQHALIRRNFGCTHFIVGRDHAGFGDFYDKYAAQEIFDEFDEDELGITPMFFNDSFYCARCSGMATEKTCPHKKNFRINPAGTATREIIRYGYLPPKEVMRPEVTQIAMQGIQPKGVDQNGLAMKPPGNTVKSVFPYYMTNHRLGGYPRVSPLSAADLTIKDLESALNDARENADRIYRGIYNELVHFFEITRDSSERWKTEAMEGAIQRQSDLVEMLNTKVESAEESVLDPFMYQDRREAMRELEVAESILGEIPVPLKPKEFKKRIWNPLDFEKYRHTLDLSGEVCPITLIKTQQKIKEVNSGEELSVLTDFPFATVTIPSWAEREGYKVEVKKASEETWEIVIEK